MANVPTESLKVTARPAARSSVVLEVELPAEQVRRSVEQALRHLARRTRVPGFRPGKAPRPLLERALGVRRDDPDSPDPVYDDAKEHLFGESVLEAVRQEDLDILSIPEPEWLSFEEGAGAAYRVTLPLRPKVELGAYRDYPFGITIDEITDQRVGQVIDELRDQQATLVPVEERGAQKGDYAVIAFEGSHAGQPIEGAKAERMPLVLGGERLIPGFEDQLVGMKEGGERTFSLTFPDDYPDQQLAGKPAEFTVSLLELREKRLPEADDDFARSIGDKDSLAGLREEISNRLERRELDRARHRFADRIIEFAVANATVELPDLLVEQEIEVMFDELRIRLAEQGIGWEDYLRVTERDEAKLREEFQPDAQRRVKTLLVLSEIAEKENVEVDEATLAAELERSRQRYAGNQRLLDHLESARGQAYTRSLLRRSQTIEKLVDEWIEQHPEFASVQHLHEDNPPEDATTEKGNG